MRSRGSTPRRGYGGHHAAWWQQVAALAVSYSVITIDLRGFGNSRWESDHDARNFPADIIAVRAALDRPDLAAGVILAHSLGGLRDAELTALVKADRARGAAARARQAADTAVPGRAA